MKYKTLDGVLLSKKTKAIIRYPQNNKKTDYIIPSEIKKIAEFSFSNCFHLTHIIIPEYVSSIGDRAFLNCHNLSTVSFYGVTTSIAPWAFDGCNNVTFLVRPGFNIDKENIHGVQSVLCELQFVEFVTNCDVICPKRQYIGKGNKINKPIIGSRKGYEFVGWFTDQELTIPWNFDFTLESDIILNAKWELST